jgi:hypothetical protein
LRSRSVLCFLPVSISIELLTDIEKAFRMWDGSWLLLTSLHYISKRLVSKPVRPAPKSVLTGLPFALSDCECIDWFALLTSYLFYISSGTIFGVYHRLEEIDHLPIEEKAQLNFLQNGARLIAAVYVLYSSAIIFCASFSGLTELTSNY